MSFQELLGSIKTVGIVEELMEIWPNEVCDNITLGINLIVWSYLNRSGNFLNTALLKT